VAYLWSVDVSYTPVPKSFTLSGGNKKDQYYASFWSLASLGFQKTRDWAWSGESSRTFPVISGSGEKLEPDAQMLCFDLLYYVGLANEEEVSGVIFHFTPKLSGNCSGTPTIRRTGGS
jgi:hypothetical protein